MPVNEEKLYALSGRQGRCRFCGKQFNFKGQIKSHRCTLRLACRRQYQEAVARNSDIKLLYPQWSTYDVAAQNNSFPNGQNPIPDYLGLPESGIPPDQAATDGTGSDAVQQPSGIIQVESPVADTTVEVQVPTTMDVSPDSLASQSGDGNQPRQLVKVVSRLAEQAVEAKVLVAKGISNKKEWGWRPIILVLHELKMWLFKAKINSTYFKLNVDQIKLMCNAYFNTFGDSPLTRITGKEFDMDKIDFISAEMTVYGDFYIENIPHAIGHGKSLFGSVVSWKNKLKEAKPIVQGQA